MSPPRSAPCDPMVSMCQAGSSRLRGARARTRLLNLSRLRGRPLRGWPMMQTDAVAEHERALADLLAGRYPDERGRYGAFGGRYVPETLIPAHERLERGAR